MGSSKVNPEDAAVSVGVLSPMPGVSAEAGSTLALKGPPAPEATVPIPRLLIRYCRVGGRLPGFFASTSSPPRLT